ncbi:MAG: tyrosine-type recombinase/integrase [Chloroflexota bacterium]
MSYKISADSTVNIVFEHFLKQPGRISSTKKKFRYKMGPFLAEHGDKPLKAIDSECLENWFVYIEERKGFSKGHLAFHRNCFVTFFNFCRQWLDGESPADSIPRYPQKPAQVITANSADLEKGLRVCELQMWQSIHQQRDAAIFTLGASGMRRSNIERTRYSDVVYALKNPITVNGQLVYIIKSDGKEGMEAVLDERRAAIIKRYVDNRPKTAKHNRLFINLDTRHKSYLQPLSKEGLLRARKKVCKLAGISVVSFQKMRRLVGSTVARKHGVEVAAQVLGHKSGVSVVIDHYYDPDKEAARRAALDAYSPNN